MNTKPKNYSSFDEIELDLQILKLEREIHAQKLKMGVEKTKKNLQPSHLLQDFLGKENESSAAIIEPIIQLILQFTAKSFKEKE
jgi:peptidyl-tRNA hydrolase